MLVDRAVRASGLLLPDLMRFAITAVLNPATSKLRNDDDRLTLGRVSMTLLCAPCGSTVDLHRPKTHEADFIVNVMNNMMRRNQNGVREMS